MVLDELLANLSVQVQPFAICHISPGWRLRLPEPPVPLLHFVLEGEGAVLGATDEPETLGPSGFVVVPPGGRHALQAGDPIEHEQKIDPPDGAPVCQLLGGSLDDASFVVACGFVTVEYGPALSLFDHLSDLLAADLSAVPPVKLAFQAILHEQAGLGAGSAAMTQALMTQCLVHFLRKLASRGSLPWLDALGDPRLGRVIDRILEDPSANHTVESLAEIASMSRSAFSEKFVAAFRQTPMTLVQHVRMQYAAGLLRQSDALSIDAIAARSGIEPQSFLDRLPQTPWRLTHRVPERAAAG